MDGENVKLMPMDNVYSYFMFLSPLERHKNPHKFSWNVMVALLLIALNLFIQGTVLYAIFNTVVAGEVVWRNSIISLSGHSINPLAPPPSQCNAGGSLCLENNGTFTCAPPSVQLAGRWDMLDLNSDGIWTKEEVLKARKDLECQFAVDPLEVFNVFVSFLKKRAEVIWLHPLVRSGEALHKHYFDFAKGDIIMCNYRNSDMCPNLLKRGFFDSPLRTGSSPRVGTTIDSALNYCYELLKPGGVCERTLPSAYSVWRKSSEKQCLGTAFHQFDYKHPKTGKEKSLLQVDYLAVTDYEKGRRSMLFMTYKSIIILMFVLCVVMELKDILIVFTWLLTFPAEDPHFYHDHDEHGEHDDETVSPQQSPTGRSEISTGRSLAQGSEASPHMTETSPRDSDAGHGDHSDHAIHGITTQHRLMMSFLTVVRLAVALLTLWVGTVFLQQDTDYVNLLLNGVALVFIIEIANCLYGQLLSEELRESFEGTEPFTVSMTNVWKVLWIKNAALRDFVRFIFIAAMLVGCMYLHYAHIAKPLSRALECTCLSQGDHCFEATEYNKEFWTTYWEHDVPEVFASVKKMKKEHTDDDDQSEKLKGLNDEMQQFATLKVRPWDLDEVPVHNSKRDAYHKRRHRVTRLLNNRHHRVF